MILPNRQKKLLTWLLAEFPGGSLDVHWSHKSLFVRKYEGDIPAEFSRPNLDALKAAGCIEIDKQESKGVPAYGVPRVAEWHIEILPAAYELAAGPVVADRDYLGLLVRRNLRRILLANFNESEFEALCRDLEINHEDVPGNMREQRINNFFDLMDRRHRLGDLAAAMIEERPRVNWRELFEA